MVGLKENSRSFFVRIITLSKAIPEVSHLYPLNLTKNPSAELIQKLPAYQMVYYIRFLNEIISIETFDLFTLAGLFFGLFFRKKNDDTERGGKKSSGTTALRTGYSH